MKETMERVPLMKEIVDYYSGPDRVTAKQQQEELERVARTVPVSAPKSVKQFADRAVLSLQVSCSPMVSWNLMLFLHWGWISLYRVIAPCLCLCVCVNCICLRHGTTMDHGIWHLYTNKRIWFLHMGKIILGDLWVVKHIFGSEDLSF